MNNGIQAGNSLTLTMPYAVSAGAGVQVGAALFGIAQNTYASGATGVMVREGVFGPLAKATGAGQSFAVGARMFWDNTNKNLTATSTGNLQVGIALSAAATGDATIASVLLESQTPAGT